MQFTAMVRYDPEDPFSVEMFAGLHRRGIEVMGLPTVVGHGEKAHVWLEASDAVPVHMICAALDAELGPNLLGLRIGGA